MMIYVELPVTWLRFVIRVSVLCMLAVGLIGHCMLLPHTKKLNTCSYIINLL